MSATYESRYEAVFLCTHPKGPIMSYAAAAMYMGKSINHSLVSGWYDIKRQKLSMTLPEGSTVGKVTPELEKMIVSLFLRNPNLRGKL